MAQAAERHEFQTEVKQLLDLMINSLYSHKEVFLRELISNASDALDKLRFEGITDPALLPDGELRIFLSTGDGTLTIEDNGIGMTRQEVVDNIGTIARSGSQSFLESVEAARKKGGDDLVNPDLIGQFGVGFYSAFMVADKIELVTRRAGQEESTRWESTGDGGYDLSGGDRPQAGTTVTLHLKKDDAEAQDYCAQWKVREIVKRYSDFLAYPIKMMVTRTEQPEGDDSSAKPVTVLEEEQLNSGKAIWLRDHSTDEVSREEHADFYKHISHDWTEPLMHLWARMEGNFDVRALLYVPAKAPFDLNHREMTRRGLQLYVKRVFIMDECKELMPDHLRFIKGVVDAEDLSLNVSREMLQQDKQVSTIRKHLVKKIEDALTKLRDTDSDKYLTFWNEFGAVLKEGLISGEGKRDRLMGLVMAPSTDSDQLTSFAQYVERMQEGQEHIYYITGESNEVVANSPHLEAFKDKNYEVLFFVDRVDEVWLENAPEFDGKKLKSVGKGEVELGSEEERKSADEARQAKQEELGDMLLMIRSRLQDDVKEVRLSGRLTHSPVCLVTEEGGITPQMEAMMRQMGQEVPKVKRILEMNGGHPIVEKLNSIHAADKTDPRLGDYAKLLYGQAILAEGGTLPEPAAFAKLVADLMLQAAE